MAALSGLRARMSSVKSSNLASCDGKEGLIRQMWRITGLKYVSAAGRR